MKKNRKIIPAILLIATTAFASFACKNKADTKTKPVDNETAFAVCNTAFQGTKNAEKFTKTEQISYKNELEDAFSYAVDSTTFERRARKSSRFESGMERHYEFVDRLRYERRDYVRLFRRFRNLA